MIRARRAAPIVAAAIAVLLLVGLPTVTPPGTGGSLSPTTGTPALPTGPVTVAPAYVPGPGVRSLGPLGANVSVDVLVGLAPSDPLGLQAQLALEYASGSPEQGRFLSAATVAARYAPSPSTYDAAVRYFEAAGTAVRESPDRSMLLVEGPAPSVARAFHTEFEAYQAGVRTFYSHPTPSSLPPLAPWSGVLGLGNETPAVPFSASTGVSAPSASCSGSTPLAPCAVADAYNVSGLYAAGTNGSGVTVGVVDTYDGTEKQTTLASDLKTFAGLYGLPVGTVRYLYPVPTSTNLNTTSTGWGAEEALDLEWSRATAPGAALDMTFAPDATAGLYFSVDWLVANQLVNVISLSWGEPDVGAFNTYNTPCSSACNATSDGSYSVLHPVLEAAALEGIGVFSASGDCGAAMGTAGDSTSYPASDPDATGVGGTDLSLNGLTWAGETGWSGNDTGATSPGCQNQGGSGGGFSPFPRPVWQSAPGVPVTPDVRGVPDVSIVGGTPVGIVMNGFDEGEEGTSVATPIWAGLEAVADQLHGGPLGLLDPSLYALARGASAARYFHDVVTGYNGYSAGPGWDPVTGIGSPNASALLPALAGGSELGPVVAPVLWASDRTGPAPLAVGFTSSVPAGAPPVAGYDVDFGDGNATWSAGGSASHTYPDAGVYDAQTVVFYADGNSSASSPVLVLAGAGAPLSVRLSVNVTLPAVGVPIALQVAASGGVAPYRYSYYFGDGTYYLNATPSNWTHSYGAAGGFCAVVFVTDASSPEAGGASLEVPISVGGATPAACPDEHPMSVTLPPEPVAMDLPANVDLTPTVTGGAGPSSVRYVSDDPYVTECQCGIFRIPGNHTIWAYANDSVSGGAETQLNLTAYPALDGSFTATPQGPPQEQPTWSAPLTVDFTATESGGHNASADATVWSFGDGTSNVSGATASHTYNVAGTYVAAAVLHDPFNGTAASVFLIDVLPAEVPVPAGVSATVDLGAGAAAGNVVSFTASPNAYDDGAGDQFRWALGDNDSAFGYDSTQSYTTGCLAADRCPLSVTLNATDSLGVVANVTFTLPFPFFGRSSALTLSDTLSGAGGPTPYVLNGTATTSVMPGARIEWEFGNGNQSNGTSVHETYYDPGNYTIAEFAEDTIGDVEVRSHTVVVTGAPVTPLNITGGPSLLEGLAPMSVTFHANASGGFGAPYSYAWQLGDGVSAVGPWANQTYGVWGNYTVNLTVTDARGTVLELHWLVQAFDQTPVQFLLQLFPTVVAPQGVISANLTTIAFCTRGSVTGCSSSNVTYELVSGRCPADIFAACPALGVASSIPGLYVVDVTAVGFYYGSGEAVYEVAGPGASGPTPVQLALLGGGIGGAAAAVLIAVGFRPRRREKLSP